MGHGKAWQDRENEALARAWLSVSENPIVGTGQTSSQMWDSVFKHFAHTLPGTARTAKALEVHWSSMQRDVSKFSAIYARLSAAQPSGTVEADVRALAKQEFEKIQKGVFRYIGSWEILHVAPKFNTRLAQAQISFAANKRQRDEREPPVGVKKAKEVLENKRIRQRELRYTKKLAQESLRRTNMTCDHMAMSVFSDAAPDDPDAAELRALLRAKYLRLARAQAAEALEQARNHGSDEESGHDGNESADESASEANDGESAIALRPSALI